MDINLRGYLCSNDDADVLRWWGWMDITAPMDIQRGLEEANGEDVTILVNSPGGSMAVGTEIFSILRRYQGNADALVQSMAASSATLAIASCRKVSSEPGALFCYHNPAFDVDGDWLAHQKAAEELKSAAEAIINIYAKRTGRTREDLAELMNADKLISPQEAMGYGLVDEVVGMEGEAGPSAARLIAALGNYPRVTESMRSAYGKQLWAEREKQARCARARLEALANY